MTEQENRLKRAIEEFMQELQQILDEIKEEAVPVAAPTLSMNLPLFFDSVRPVFGGRMTGAQVSGTETLLKAFKEADFPVSWAAYGLATVFHETAKKMQPVREGLNASEAWRRKNLRYYPWYGRGGVQLTWRDNYVKADEKLGLGGALVENPDLALDPVISSLIVVNGMKEGWFSKDKKGPHSLPRHLPNPVATRAQFRQARRIINLMDKADDIANLAMKFQDALVKAEY